MKVCYVLPYYEPYKGGLETLFKNLAERMTKLKLETIVITSLLKDTKKYEEINGVKVYRIKIPMKFRRFWFVLFSLPYILIHAKNSDIIHTTTFAEAFPSFLASKILKKPCIITVHEVFSEDYKNIFGFNALKSSLYKFFEKIIISLQFDKYICVSNFTRNRLIKIFNIPKNKVKTIYNAIDYSFFNPRKYNKNLIRKKYNLKDKFVYISWGRPGISKGTEYLIRAVPSISEKIPNSKLILILGKDPKYRYNYILNLIKKLGIENNIILLDTVPQKELPKYIVASDCAVIPSLTEGFGYNVVESCALNVPIVATEVGSIPEVISRRFVLIKPKSPSDIVKGCELIYNKKIISKKFKRFEWKNTITEYENMYKEVLGNI